jgi:hypothetical protein
MSLKLSIFEIARNYENILKENINSIVLYPAKYEVRYAKPEERATALFRAINGELKNVYRELNPVEFVLALCSLRITPLQIVEEYWDELAYHFAESSDLEKTRVQQFAFSIMVYFYGMENPLSLAPLNFMGKMTSENEVLNASGLYKNVVLMFSLLFGELDENSKIPEQCSFKGLELLELEDVFKVLPEKLQNKFRRNRDIVKNLAFFARV